MKCHGFVPLFMFFLVLFSALTVRGGLADGHDKFLGNIFQSTTDNLFDTYWNQVTPENVGKWGIAESVRDKINWAPLDEMFAYARDRVFSVKEHTFVWGMQKPNWIDGLSQAEQAEEVEEWIQLFSERYPDVQQIDVVNEPIHQPPSYRGALGGNGTTGWDWVIWAFEKARQYAPNANLLLNEWGILSSASTAEQYIDIIQLLQDRGLIDGIGCQGHFLENTSATTIQQNLDRVATLGLPIYISELDINIADDANQLSKYQEIFPVLWSHPAVAGVTLWGYKQGAIWRQNAYLVRSDGSERPALIWLRDYLAVEDVLPPAAPTNLRVKASTGP